MPDVQHVPDWINELNDEIGELLSNNKVVKFSTHGNRKAFIAKVRSLIKETILTKVTQNGSIRDSLGVTHPNPNPSQGHTVMTPGKSQQVDAINEQRASQTQRVRVW